MKLIIGLFSACAAYQIYAASPKALVYTSEGSSKHLPSSESPSVSPTTARLLFAQRLGLSHYHSLDGADEDTIELINQFGGKHGQLFIDRVERQPDQKVLVFVENVEHPEDILGAESAKPAFIIEHPPSSSQNLQLALDLLSQDRHLSLKSERPCHFEFSTTSRKGLQGGINAETDGADEPKDCRSKDPYFDILRRSNPIENIEFMGRTESIPGSTYIIHISLLEDLTRQDGEHYDRVAQGVSKLLFNFRFDQRSYTVVFMPPNSKNPQGASTSSYGSYTIPSTIQRRGHVSEEPLSAHAAPPPSSKNSHPSSLKTLKNPVLLKGILPLCQPSKEKCITATNNCSGHGTPYRKPIDPSAKSAKECWTCHCDDTLRTDKDGKVIKTTQWGGPACRKKDVSVPFFLLAGLTIALVTIVSWGIGLLYSIGQEDLPSVIGAGVTGPRAQK